MKAYSLYVLGILLVSSCAGNSSNSESKVKEVASVQSLSTDISEYVSVVDVKPIDDSIVFANVSKMVADESGNYYILDSRGTIVSITADGKVGPLSITRGRASNEYASASDICYQDGTFYILENSRIKAFDIKDTHNNKITDRKGIPDPVDAISCIPGGGFYLFSAFSKSARADRKGFDNMLRMIDGDGKVVSEALPREDCTFSMNNISQSRDNTYFLRPQSSESIFYRLGKDGAEPAFKVDFGEKTMPARYYFDVCDEDMGAYMLSEYYKLPMDLHDTKHFVYNRFCGDQASECSLVYSRKTKKCIAWKNTNEDSGFRILGSDNDSFILISTNTEGQYGPLGRAVYNALKEVCPEGQRAIVKVEFKF